MVPIIIFMIAASPLRISYNSLKSLLEHSIEQESDLDSHQHATLHKSLSGLRILHL